jgi:hypothetical protein
MLSDRLSIGRNSFHHRAFLYGRHGRPAGKLFAEGLVDEQQFRPQRVSKYSQLYDADADNDIRLLMEKPSVK